MIHKKNVAWDDLVLVIIISLFERKMAKAVNKTKKVYIIFDVKRFPNFFCLFLCEDFSCGVKFAHSEH